MRMKGRDVILLVLTVLLIAALTGYILTRETATPQPSHPRRKPEAAPAKLVDQSPLQTAHDLAPLASTTEEQKLAAESIGSPTTKWTWRLYRRLQATELHPPA